MSRLILTTLNARYIHSAFGLRYLYANLQELQTDCRILEFGINQRPVEIVEALLQARPQIIGFGVYIWNVSEISAVLAILRQVAPDIILVLGGPEVSHPPDLPAAADYADYIITGHAELSFRQLCRELAVGHRPAQRIISGETAPLTALASPYPYYTDTDIQQRLIYVEASRGCPFKCEFCLSALDSTAKPFALPAFLQDMDTLYQRGARHFKFIDRTFNLKLDASIQILDFFLQRLSPDLFLHFEVIPDNLPERLQQVIQQFPPGVLQFEIGVQSFDAEVQQRISRRQDNAKTQHNLRWLRQHTHTHIHADLIVGLPGDTLSGFGRSFDQLIALNPQEIQVGILKRLRGAPINRHSETYQMRYDPNPPYTILSTRDMDFNTLQRLNRFARYWDMIGNSGRFSAALAILLADQPFANFLQFSDALYAHSSSTWQIALKRLFELTYQVMTASLQLPADQVAAALQQDFARSGEKSLPDFLKHRQHPSTKPATANRRQQRFQIIGSG